MTPETDAASLGAMAAAENSSETIEVHEAVPLPSQKSTTLMKEEKGEPKPRPDVDISLPQTWSKARKWWIILVLALVSLMVAISLVINAPASNAISEQFDNHNGFLSVFFITVPNLGQAVAAFYIGPLSERFGRVPVCHFFNAVWLIFTLAGGFSSSISQIIVFRFFTGAAISSINLNPAVAGDLFSVNQRGFALSIASLIPLAGSAVGPLVGGYVT